jgi:hypothetical protein
MGAAGEDAAEMPGGCGGGFPPWIEERPYIVGSRPVRAYATLFIAEFFEEAHTPYETPESGSRNHTIGSLGHPVRGVNPVRPMEFRPPLSRLRMYSVMTERMVVHGQVPARGRISFAGR